MTFYTITKVWRAKWYKRPFLWLLGRPTDKVEFYHNVTITDIRFESDGEHLTSKFEFTGDKEND